MKDKQPLKEQLDNLMPKQRLIENHALSNVDAHTKELYMTLLAAIAFEDRKLEQREEHYLQTLCNSVKDVDYESIQRRIDKIGDTLEESLKAIEENKLAVWLFIDALILCRLDSEITEKESKLLGSLADSLKLSPKEVSLCLKLATIILSQDEAILYEMIPEVPNEFPFYALHEAYISSWFDTKFSFADDLAKGRELKGKYFIHKPVSISGERELKDVEFVFAVGAKITIGEKAKLKITGSKLSQVNITCTGKSSLMLSKCQLSGGEGIYCNIGSSLSVNQSQFDNVGIVSDKASKIVLNEVSFENLIDKRAMSLTKCTDVALKKSKFISCGYGVENAKKAEGGALLLKDCNILIAACHFENCTASGDGGALSMWDCVYEINDSKFIGCQSAANGGAMALHGEGKMDESQPKGSGFLSFRNIDYTDISITKDSEFIQCIAGDSGGAYIDYMQVRRFQGCLFEKCSAKVKGGAGMALHTKGFRILEDYTSYRKYTRILECRFRENKAPKGNGLWMSCFNCRSKEDRDIVGSTFYKCSTNHNHEDNSVYDYYDSCNLDYDNNFSR